MNHSVCSVIIINQTCYCFLSGTVVIMAIPLFEEVQRFTLQLPNSANFAFYFPWFLHFYLLILAVGKFSFVYGKCPKISTPKFLTKSHKYANSADPDQMAPEGAI